MGSWGAKFVVAFLGKEARGPGIEATEEELREYINVIGDLLGEKASTEGFEVERLYDHYLKETEQKFTGTRVLEQAYDTSEFWNLPDSSKDVQNVVDELCETEEYREIRETVLS